MGFRITINDFLVDETIKNYVDRAIAQEAEENFVDSGREEYDIVYPAFEDLPRELRTWIKDNNVKVMFYYNERVPNWLEFENEHDLILFKMRWG
jgi:hypothetical protein